VSGTSAEACSEQSFAANRFPLDPGIRLLEASAGTGKTFALAHLVLRLVAEQGTPLRRLLVVTYTNAAAAELRMRIGLRLQQALQALEGAEGSSLDAVLANWLEALPAGEERNRRGRLLLALEDLAAADITTIHGFCRRSLQRHALEARSQPDLRLETEAGELYGQIVHDYWQQQALALPPELLAGLLDAGVKPEGLQELLTKLDGDPALALEPLPPGSEAERPLPAWLPSLWADRWQAFGALWQDEGEALEAELLAIGAQWKAAGTPAKDYPGKTNKPRAAQVQAWIDAQHREGAPPAYPEVRGQKQLNTYFHPAAFSKAARKAEGAGREPSLPRRRLMEAVAALIDGPAELVLLHACHWCRGELRRRRERSGSVGFSQLLEALDPGPGTTEPTPLLQVVAGHYDVALIDEFQDTDPIQWRILRLAFGRGDHLLVMVGDPKQAIYRFRGGDLATYLAAAGEASCRYRLEENRRSTPELIEALNALMAPGLGRSGLDVPRVLARADRSGPLPAPIELLWLGGTRLAGDPPPSRSVLAQHLPETVASYVNALLGRGLELRSGERSQPLQPEHLCLLVSTHQQAEDLRAALERRGLATRLVSRVDVFASPAATALQRFLVQLAASPLLGWSAARIADADAGRWSALAGQLDGLARLLERRGLLGLLNDLVTSAGLARLSLGGRLLADLQQVTELVQERIHADQLGPAAAADWLRRLRLDPDRYLNEAHMAQSDRVDGAISVVTVHRSKGLEYPVVICPYLWEAPGGADRSLRSGVRWLPDGAGEPRLGLHLSPAWGEGRRAAEQQRRAEEAERERLAYVALTRAQHLLVLAWGPAKEQQCNPLFPWLYADDPLPSRGADPIGARADDDWRQRLDQQIEQRQLPLRIVEPAELEAAPAYLRPAPLQELALEQGPVPRHRLDRSWGRSSYTSWTHSALEVSEAAPLALEEGRDTDALSRDTVALSLDPGPSFPATATATAFAEADSGAWPEQGLLGDFPRGAAAGDCLHRILEHLDYTAAPGEAANLGIVERELRRAGLEEQAPDRVLAGLEQMLHTPCGGPLGPFRIGALPRQRRLNEMNFDLPLGLVRAQALAEAFASHPGGSFGRSYAERLAALPVASRGFLTGSIDLLFTAPDSAGQPRWWVADWKSNWLGLRDPEGRPVACGPRHYGAVAMADLMAANHYPLQAHLYLVALHRYLRWRLPGYEPSRDLGGYVYVFLRGTPGAGPDPGVPVSGEAKSGYGKSGYGKSVPGMFVEQPPLERLFALDAALAGGSHG
jgi:exodeoxyribonuclease V beta subunit